MDLKELDANRQLARAARRKPMNEAGLVWSLVGIAVYLVTFGILKEYPSIPIPFGLSFAGACVFAGVVIGGCVALGYLVIARKSVKRAREEHAKFLHQAQAEQRSDVEKRIRAMANRHDAGQTNPRSSHSAEIAE